MPRSLLPVSPRTAPLRVGLVYDTFDAFRWRDGDPPDADAEYEPPETVDALDAALVRLGCTVVRIGTAHDLLNALPRLQSDPGARLDAALSIAEGRDGLNREGFAPTLLEMAGIPILGPDALTLSVSLDKAWTKTLVADAGVRVVPGVAVSRPDDLDGLALPPFPVFVKPRFEGSSKGITAQSKVASMDALRAQVAWVAETYRQDALVEAFVEGTEFTVAVVGHDPPRALPALQRAVEAETGIGLHALEHRGIAGRDATPPDFGYRLETKALTPTLEAELADQALRAFRALRCRDFARMDFRVDAHGTPYFLEANPLPTFAPDGTFAILAELAGQPYEAWLAEVLADALRRALG